MSLDYETIDWFADLYIPLLVVWFLGGLMTQAMQRPIKKPYLARVFLFFMGMLMFSYGVMFLDNTVHIWPAFNLDYSTHTAVSLTLVISLCVLIPRYWKWTALSFVLYGWLMMYQKYHTFLDIFSTLAVVLFCAATLWCFLVRKK